jgi:hypothetical protein
VRLGHELAGGVRAVRLDGAADQAGDNAMAGGTRPGGSSASGTAISVSRNAIGRVHLVL